ncbi:unnamed protein product [Sphagnum troendelagicum]|uniref:Protein kinase domain-containing protein n=1 Tax=Sphagnum troendelagicum TaxID=128251 RepID=A0ABP0U5V0_9BRYO
MCLVKLRRQVSSKVETTSLRGKSKKTTEDMSLEVPTSYTRSLTFSRGSKTSVDSSKSLEILKGMLPDGAYIFNYLDIAKATDHFNPSRKVGASVFRGTVMGMDVAIVQENKGSRHINFVAELKNLCNLHHSNLVKVIGGCIRGDQVYLVYEFITGGTLRECLRSTIFPGFTALNSWTARLQVALDVAKGLEYLHQHAVPPLVHKYIKSSSIILDSELHARIAKVGVAQIKGECSVEPLVEVSSPIGRSRSIRITGITGYLAPEYAAHGSISPKIDVFAFGVILLEILSGQEAVQLQQDLDENCLRKTFLPDVIAAIFADKDPRSRIRGWIDPLLRDAFPLDWACKAAQVAKSCVNPDPQKRPEMCKVTLNLEHIFMASQVWQDSRTLLTTAITAR